MTRRTARGDRLAHPGSAAAAGRVAAGGVLAAGLVLGGAGNLLTAPVARAATCAGVTVVVQYEGQSPVARCAPGDPASGLAALTGAGFAVTPVQGQGGAVCRIDGEPASMPCNRMPPATAYWSYWYASPGGGWTYSSKGAASRDPAPGTYEGWRFGNGSAAPAFGIPTPPASSSTSTARAATRSTSAPTAAQPTSGGGSDAPSTPRTTAAPGVGSGASTTDQGGGSTGTRSGSAPGSGGGRSASAHSSSTSGSSRTRSAGTSSTSRRSSTSSDAPTVAATPSAAATTGELAPASDASAGGTGWWPALAGVVLLAALGAATAVTARRRRSQ